jgi:hypothetical protein
MEINATDGIAGLALLVSLLSAISADRSANSAESSATSAIIANRLAQHNERLAIYKSLQRFNFEIHARGYAIADEVLWAFADAANISEFYYPQKEAKALAEILDAGNKYIAMRDLWKSHKEAGAHEEARAALKSLNKQGSELREMCRKCDEALREHLRLEQKSKDDVE